MTLWQSEAMWGRKVLMLHAVQTKRGLGWAMVGFHKVVAVMWRPASSGFLRYG